MLSPSIFSNAKFLSFLLRPFICFWCPPDGSSSRTSHHKREFYDKVVCGRASSERNMQFGNSFVIAMAIFLSIFRWTETTASTIAVRWESRGWKWWGMCVCLVGVCVRVCEFHLLLLLFAIFYQRSGVPNFINERKWMKRRPEIEPLSGEIRSRRWHSRHTLKGIVMPDRKLSVASGKLFLRRNFLLFIPDTQFHVGCCPFRLGELLCECNRWPSRVIVSLIRDDPNQFNGSIHWLIEIYTNSLVRLMKVDCSDSISIDTIEIPSKILFRWYRLRFGRVVAPTSIGPSLSGREYELY